jgi:uncharacterized protein YegP (UPF0339 family)
MLHTMTRSHHPKESRTLKVEILRSRDPQRPYYWRLLDGTGTIIATSAPHATRDRCLDAIAVATRGLRNAALHDRTGLQAAC